MGRHKLLWGLVWGIGLPILIVVLYLAYMTATDYRPAAAINLEIKNNQTLTNVAVQRTSGHNLAFRNSDHNPVSMVFVLK